MMIIEEDIQQIIEDYSDILYQKIKLNESLDLLITEIINKLRNHYEIQDTTLFQNSQLYYIHKIVHFKIQTMKEQLLLRFHHKQTIQSKIETLKNLKLPDQRTPEWYEMRDKMLTSSSLADAIGKGHFKTRDDLLIEKTSKEKKPRFSSWIIEWGVRYEPVATTFYEKLNNLKVLEFGLVPHPELKIFGASPDGICDIDSPEDYIGRMLEIKCPPKREFTKEVPKHYWMQMQGQLETCDLEECDFLQVKLLEYETEEKYIEDQFFDGDILKEGISSNGLPKGLVISFVSVNDTLEETYHYEYSEFYQSFEQLKIWSDKIIKEYTFNYSSICFHWWKIERYECTLVGRDRQWWINIVPEILNFWEDVEYYRKEGNQLLIDKKENRKKKRKINKEKKEKKENKKNIITINQEINQTIESSYLLESDSED
tara:strand:+ start:3864 stop:5144 length:1281 start_codon:yes stop_codon:yes gene_type:complete